MNQNTRHPSTPSFLSDDEFTDIIAGVGHALRFAESVDLETGETVEQAYPHASFSRGTVWELWDSVLEFLEEAGKADVRAALEAYVGVVVDEDSPANYLGHDIALTVNGHGAGFWDRGFGDLGDRLTTAAHKMRHYNVYVQDNIIFVKR